MKMTRIIAMLPVRSMSGSVEFYRKLGFEVQDRRDDWGWAMLHFGESRLMVDQSINQHPTAVRQSVLYLYVDDIKAYHEQVRQNGIAIPDLDLTFYGMTEFRLDDPDGNDLPWCRAADSRIQFGKWRCTASRRLDSLRCNSRATCDSEAILCVTA